MSARSPTSPSFHPAANSATFKDVLRFESRLIQNAERLTVQRRKFQAFLAALVTSILCLAYCVFVDPSIYTLVHYTYSGLLLVATTSLILFFATGMYSEKIASAYKFVPQANRSLRPFNMHLNTRSPGLLSSLGLRRRRRAVELKRSTSRLGLQSSTKDSPEKARPTSPSSRQPIQSMPIASNPSGEIIFSNRVNPSFTEGYESYRAEWNRRHSTNPAQGRGSVAAEKVSTTQSGPSQRLGRRLSRGSDISANSPPTSRDASPDSEHVRGSSSTYSRESSPPSLSHSRPASADSSGPPSPRSLPPNDEEDYSSAFGKVSKSRQQSFSRLDRF